MNGLALERRDFSECSVVMKRKCTEWYNAMIEKRYGHAAFLLIDLRNSLIMATAITNALHEQERSKLEHR